ncbi:MAG TPA: Gfo/Idh/MocA family oxidoreductase [archaeon]|nr:Gfo/Idh/MocA family oxidoreductase [archaeon]
MQSRGKVSRRNFIRSTSGIITGAVGLSALGAPEIISHRNSNSRINLGIIGTGSRACFILRSMRNTDKFTVTDLCDIYPPHLEQAKALAGNPGVRTYSDWQKLLEQKDVDAILVVTPLSLHVPMSISALRAGKHVMSEKTMGLTVSQINSMLAEVEKTSQVYMVGYQDRLNESFAEVKRLVRSGSIGKITQFYAHYDRNITWRRDNLPPEWDRILNWRLYKEYCGGLITEVIAYEFDRVLDILGTRPNYACCNGEIMIYKDGREHHDSVMGSIKMEDGVLGLYSGHLSNSRMGGGWSIHGTHGTIEYEVGTVRIYWETDTRHLDSIGIQHQFNKITLGQSLALSENPTNTPAKVIKYENETYESTTAFELEHFADCILEGKQPVMDAKSSIRTSIAALMAYHSSMNGGRLVTREEIEAMG